MKTVNNYLKKADQAIKDTQIAVNGKIPTAYKGAVSSFGASIVMSGLVPTIQFYLGNSERKEADTMKILEAIARVVYTDGACTAERMKTEIMANINNRVEMNKHKKKITDAAIALKIMMRSYQFSDDDE